MSMRSCLELQASCAGGQCAPESLEVDCRFNEMDQTAAAVVRAEMRAIADRRPSQIAMEICSDEFLVHFETALNSIRTEGPLDLAEPYAPMPGANELDSPIETELFWRAQTEERLTGLAVGRARNDEPSVCNQSPLAGVILVRAQNLAFAESVDALTLARDGRLSAPALWAVWFIYNHADLWRAEQAEAAEIFSALAEDGLFDPVLARNLSREVSEQPLYIDDQLVGCWPD